MKMAKVTLQTMTLGEWLSEPSSWRKPETQSCGLWQCFAWWLLRAPWQLLWLPCAGANAGKKRKRARQSTEIQFFS
jgi:hypothetical protein